MDFFVVSPVRAPARPRVRGASALSANKVPAGLLPHNILHLLQVLAREALPGVGARLFAHGEREKPGDEDGEKRERERERERGEREREGSARRQRDLVWVDLLSAAHLLCSLENCRIVSQAHQTLLMPMPQPAQAPRREKKKGWSCPRERGRERARQGGARAKNASGASSPSSLSHPRPRTRLGGEGGERKRERERRGGGGGGGTQDSPLLVNKFFGSKRKHLTSENAMNLD